MPLIKAALWSRLLWMATGFILHTYILLYKHYVLLPACNSSPEVPILRGYNMWWWHKKSIPVLFYCKILAPLLWYPCIKVCVNMFICKLETSPFSTSLRYILMHISYTAGFSIFIVYRLLLLPLHIDPNGMSNKKNKTI